jgi:SH3-like domain-containing protein
MVVEMSLRARVLRGAGVIALAIALVTGIGDGAMAQSSTPQVTLGPSGLPLPRFVSLRSRANLRVGPGTSYAVEWQFVRPGIPLEIIQEYDNWRRVRDSDGTEGWVNQSLLSGSRTAIVAPWARDSGTILSLHAEPSESARLVARLEPGLIGSVRSCDGEWCQMNFSGVRGWLRQSRLWGVYPGETYRD